MSFDMGRVKKIVIKCVFMTIVVFLAYGWRLGTGREAHSDELSVIFVGLDIFKGNVFLKDWHFSTGIFGLPTIELAIATCVFGYSETVIYIIAAMNYAFMIGTAIFVVGLYVRKKNLEKSYVYILITIFALIIPRSVTLLNAGTHVLSYAASILAHYITYYLSKNNCSIAKKTIWILALGILAVTNSAFLYTTCIPIVLTGAVVSWEERRKISPYMIYGILSIILYMLFGKLWVLCRGEGLGGISTVFTEKERIWNNIAVGICNILEIFGIDVWGENVISIHTFKALVGLMFLLKLIYEICKFFRSEKKHERELIYSFLGMAVVNICAYMVSTLPLYSSDVNLIQPFLLGLVMSGVLAWIHNISMGQSKHDNGLMLACSVMLFVFMFPPLLLKQPDNTDRQQLAEYLRVNGYEKGFADFWESASVMYATKGRVTISPVICHNIVEITDDTQLVAYKWMNKKDWEQQEGNFLIIDSESEARFGINYDRIISTFGQWSDTIQFGDITLFVWDDGKKLMDYGEN